MALGIQAKEKKDYSLKLKLQTEAVLPIVVKALARTPIKIITILGPIDPVSISSNFKAPPIVPNKNGVKNYHTVAKSFSGFPANPHIL